MHCDGKTEMVRKQLKAATTQDSALTLDFSTVAWLCCWCCRIEVVVWLLLCCVCCFSMIVVCCCVLIVVFVLVVVSSRSTRLQGWINREGSWLAMIRDYAAMCWREGQGELLENKRFISKRDVPWRSTLVDEQWWCWWMGNLCEISEATLYVRFSTLNR